MWTGDPSKRVRRTGGFYLYGSRFRVQEIQYFANVLKGGNPMAIDQRYSPIAGQVGPQGAPVVNILDSRNQAQTTVIFGMLAMQFLLLMLLAWKILVPFEGAAKAEQDDKMAKIEERLSEMSSTQLLAAKNEGQQEARENIVAILSSCSALAAPSNGTKKPKHTQHTVLGVFGFVFSVEVSSTMRWTGLMWRMNIGR